MAGSLSGSIVLVVEDEPLVVLDIADCFKRAGAVVYIARTFGEAMQKVETPGLGIAVIDHALHDGITTSDVCERLKQLNIPFVVYSGFNHISGACADGKLVHKPATPEMLLGSVTAS